MTSSTEMKLKFSRWSTHWFRVHVDIPSTWEGREVRLKWNCGAEAMVWMDGHPVQVIAQMSC